ncbi:MAG: SagB/ThcOx family dehydrogenase [Candidatus Omnitrophica bacterium]|nr:SagB/ThcOx family dehydrogenase [Candidatus Omnitrophota bacterium]
MKKYLLYPAVFICTVACAATIFAEEVKTIKLSQPRLEKGKLLMQALKERKSSRDFSSRPLHPEVLSDLLWAAWGVNRPDSGKRTAPSAKNMQEIELYVAMKEALYLYDAVSHALIPVIREDIRVFVGRQDFTQIAPVDLIYVANFSKMSDDVENDIFYSAVDTGLISENVYLFCASEGLATVVLGWVDKGELAKKMSLPDDKKVILTQPVGYPK